jgi:FlaA1/EpsC-like NDP-sugar epimerase
MIKIIINLQRSILEMPRYLKQIFVITSDIILYVAALIIAFYLRLDKFIFFSETFTKITLIGVSLAIPIFWIMGLYKNMFRYSGKAEFLSILYSIFIYGFLFFLIVTINGLSGVPRTIGILHPLVFLFLIFGSRFLVRYIFLEIYSMQDSKIVLNALVYGAGSAGRQLATALDNDYKMRIAGFVDDNPLLHGQVLNGKKIYSFEDLDTIILSKKINYLLLAIPSVNRSKKAEIINKISNLRVIVRTLPSIENLIEGKVSISDIKELEVGDILDRDIITPVRELLIKNIESKVVLVSGAGGSIGSELCRQIIMLNPIKLVLVEISEFALYKIYEELNEISKKFNLIPVPKIISLLASSQDENKMQQIISSYKVDTIYHAAAYKHVPLVEENICEGVKNNIFGTLAITKAAIAEQVSNFVLVSSDKAVRPTNVMGASKRVAELCLQALYKNSKKKETKLCMVRFGNVLDSSGSVIPKFKKQIKEGGPITLTHPDVTRYFMTIPEAAELVIQASSMTKGSDVFALEMGEPVKILDLIKKIIVLSGLSVQDDANPEGDIKIQVIGLRPGEKLYEELFLGENLQSTGHIKIKKSTDLYIPWEELEPDLKLLEILINEGKVEKIINLLQKLVKEYKWNGKIVDHTYIHKTK